MTVGTRIKDLPDSERPRERVAELGVDAASSAELIGVLLRTGIKGASAVDVGRQLLQHFGTLDNLSRASLMDLRKFKGIGRDKAVTLICAFGLARRMAREIRVEDPELTSPDKIANLLREDNRLYQVEQFQVIMVNTRKRLIRVEKISQGTLDAVMVHPREVFRLAITAGAAAIIIAHNHPSGDPTPSEADIKVTRDLIRAGALLKIEVLDHVIFGRATSERPKDYISLRELGYFV